MTTENQTVFDILVTDGTPGGKLTKVGTAYPTPKGTGHRFTLKAALAEGAQILILPSRPRAPKEQPAETAA